LSCGYSKGTLFQVELDAVAVEVGESFAQVVEQAVLFQGLDDNIVDIDFDVAADLLFEACLHTRLIDGSCILQAEWHRCVAVYPMRGDEGSLVFVFDLQPYLIVS
jgi:hypothetical protein